MRTSAGAPRPQQGARLGGVPVFRGTRVPVKSLFDHLQAGDSLETFLDDFPGVSREEALGVLDLAHVCDGRGGGL